MVPLPESLSEASTVYMSRETRSPRKGLLMIYLCVLSMTWKQSSFATAQQTHTPLRLRAAAPACAGLYVSSACYPAVRGMRSVGSVHSISSIGVRAFTSLHQHPYSYSGRACRMDTAEVGRSALSVCTLPNRLTTSIPAHTRPKMVCFPSRWGVGASVTKNCRGRGGQARPASELRRQRQQQQQQQVPRAHSQLRSAAAAAAPLPASVPGCRLCWALRWPWTGSQRLCA